MGIEKTDVFVGIDGTGTGNNAQYAREFRNSHVQNLSRKSWKNKLYLRGPTLFGVETSVLAQSAADYIKFQRKTLGPDMRVFLSGYSRGGAAVLATANILARQQPQIPVEALFLFDAVNRTHNVSSTAVPGNVNYTFHALRSPGANSRPEFGNCGHNPGVGKYIYRYFHATHGGVGGTPWPANGTDPGAFINEASTEERLAGTVATGGVDVAGIVRATNVTYGQDLAGSKASGAWMEQMFVFVV